jgi:hypothetical protein
MTESFAELFEQSIASQRIRPGTILNGLIVEVGQDYVIVNVGLKSEAVIRSTNSRTSAVRSKSRSARPSKWRSTASRTAPARRACRARRPSAPAPGRAWKRIRKAGNRDRHHHRPRQGRLHGRDRQCARVPARLAGRCAPGARSVVPGKQAARIQGHQARSEAQQRRGLAPRGGRAGVQRRALRAARQPAGRRGGQGRRQEPHRLRCVRRPGRHRRPAAHHRHGVEARQASVRSRQGRR